MWDVASMSLTSPRVIPLALLYSNPPEDAVADLLGREHISALPAFHFYHHGKPVLTPVTGYKKQHLREAVLQLAQMPQHAPQH